MFSYSRGLVQQLVQRVTSCARSVQMRWLNVAVDRHPPKSAKWLTCRHLIYFVHCNKTPNAGVPCMWGSGWFTACIPASDCHLGPQHQQCAATKKFKNGAYVFRSSKIVVSLVWNCFSLLWPPRLPLYLLTLLPKDQADPNPGASIHSHVNMCIYWFLRLKGPKVKTNIFSLSLNQYKSFLENIHIWNMIFEYLDIVLTILDLPYHRSQQDKNVQPDLNQVAGEKINVLF